MSVGPFFWVPSFFTLGVDQNTLQEERLGVYPFDKISVVEQSFEKFSYSSGVLISYFFFIPSVFSRFL